MKIGTQIKTKKYGYVGEIINIHDTIFDAEFLTLEDAKSWIDSQDIKPSNDEIYNQKWYSIKVIGGGSVLVSRQDVVEYSPKPERVSA